MGLAPDHLLHRNDLLSAVHVTVDSREHLGGDQRPYAHRFVDAHPAQRFGAGAAAVAGVALVRPPCDSTRCCVAVGHFSVGDGGGECHHRGSGDGGGVWLDRPSLSGISGFERGGLLPAGGEGDITF